MFTVIRKEEGNYFEVYSVRNNKAGYPYFLIYENNQWRWQSAKHYIPIQSPPSWVSK